MKSNIKIVIIDNYDSFTYNLVHLLEKIIDDEVTVLLNDDFELKDLNVFTHIIISPGPGLPEQAGKTLEVILTYAKTKKIFGVCLGQQAIAIAFGGVLKNLPIVYHGVATNIFLEKEVSLKENHIFKNMPHSFEVGRYHSWVIDENKMPNELKVTARDENKEIMAVEHKQYNIQAVQFHPESIMTALGEQMLRNWLELQVDR